jgi:hypothetical protein
MKIFHKFKYELLILLFFVFSHLPYLGHDTFNTDVWKWKVRSYDFSTGIFTLDFAKTLQKYHPGVPLMWAGTFGIKVANLIADFSPGLSVLDNLFILHTIQKMFVVLALALSLGLGFYVLRTLFGLDVAIFSSLFLILEPFYMALTREFHLEGLLSTFMLVSILWLYYYLMQKKSFALVISAIFTGLAILTKSSGVFLVLFAGLNFLLQLKTSRNFKAEFLWFIKYLMIVAVTVFALWPALWVTPALVFSEITRGVSEIGVDTDHIQFYFGRLVGNPGPTYYPVVFALRSSVWLFLGTLGFVFVYKKLTDSQKRFSKYLLLYFFFYLIQVTIPSKKLDRYILPGMVALIFPATFFWLWIAQKIKMARIWFFTTFFGLLLLTNLILLPDFLSYYNPLFGGLHTGIRVLEPKWLIGKDEIITYFSSIRKLHGYTFSGQDDSFEEIIYRAPVKNVLSVGFQEKYYTQIWPFFREIGAWAVIQDLTPFAQKTKYFVYPVWDDRATEENRFKLTYVSDIKVRGISVYRVYERIE